MGLLRDCVVIGIGGGALGLIANALSPRGLELTRDYFPPAMAAPEGAAPSAPTNAVAPMQTKRGLPLASHAEVVALFRDPRHAQGLILFVDARDAARFAAGHIPGAKRFDHYHPEQGVADLLPIAQMAERIVVYCNGGECEDSELVVLDLVALGVPAPKLVVYGGGITEWKQRGLPIENGAASPASLAP